MRGLYALIDSLIDDLCTAVYLRPTRILRRDVSEGCEEDVRRATLLCIDTVIRRNEGLAEDLTRRVVLSSGSNGADRERILLNADVSNNMLKGVCQATRSV